MSKGLLPSNSFHVKGEAILIALHVSVPHLCSYNKVVEKHSPVSFWGLNALVQLCCVHCARFDILSWFFSETKCKPAKKIQGECFTTSSKSKCKNSGTFEGKQILPEKVTYVPLAPSHSICGIVLNKSFWVIVSHKLNPSSTYTHMMVAIAFSNSLIIHQVKTKEITTVKEVWIPDLN